MHLFLLIDHPKVYCGFLMVLITKILSQILHRQCRAAPHCSSLRNSPKKEFLCRYCLVESSSEWVATNMGTIRKYLCRLKLANHNFCIQSCIADKYQWSSY